MHHPETALRAAALYTAEGARSEGYVAGLAAHVAAWEPAARVCAEAEARASRWTELARSYYQVASAQGIAEAQRELAVEMLRDAQDTPPTAIALRTHCL